MSPARSSTVLLLYFQDSLPHHPRLGTIAAFAAWTTANTPSARYWLLMMPCAPRRSPAEDGGCESAR